MVGHMPGSGPLSEEGRSRLYHYQGRGSVARRCGPRSDKGRLLHEFRVLLPRPITGLPHRGRCLRLLTQNSPQFETINQVPDWCFELRPNGLTACFADPGK